jgi:hypothetical protein
MGSLDGDPLKSERVPDPNAKGISDGAGTPST